MEAMHARCQRGTTGAEHADMRRAYSRSGARGPVVMGADDRRCMGGERIRSDHELPHERVA